MSQTFSINYTQESRGFVEHVNLAIQFKAKSWLIQSSLPAKLWGYAIKLAAIL